MKTIGAYNLPHCECGHKAILNLESLGTMTHNPGLCLRCSRVGRSVQIFAKRLYPSQKLVASATIRVRSAPSKGSREALPRSLFSATNLDIRARTREGAHWLGHMPS